MKLRLTQAGFETYTGQMGVVMFKDGLSEGDVLPIDAIRISAAIGATWEDGSAANVGEMYLNNMDVPAFVGGDDINNMTMPVEGETAPTKKATSKGEGANEEKTEDKADTPADASAKVYTYEELSEVADKEGIAGVRKIADALSVKGTSIVGIIDAILTKQGTPRIGAE